MDSSALRIPDRGGNVKTNDQVVNLSHLFSSLRSIGRIDPNLHKAVGWTEPLSRQISQLRRFDKEVSPRHRSLVRIPDLFHHEGHEGHEGILDGPSARTL